MYTGQNRILSMNISVALVVMQKVLNCGWTMFTCVHDIYVYIAMDVKYDSMFHTTMYVNNHLQGSHMSEGNN